MIETLVVISCWQDRFTAGVGGMAILRAGGRVSGPGSVQRPPAPSRQPLPRTLGPFFPKESDAGSLGPVAHE